jgi:CO dehydrogenase/acetyl-CoA synthase alpha subunit
MMNITERNELLSMYSDVHKDAYGHRPRDWERVTLLTDEELVAECEKLGEIAMAEMAREEAAELTNALDLQNLARKLATEQGIDIPTAYRWLIAAEGDYCDLEHFLWKMGVGCGRIAYHFRLELAIMDPELR